MSDIKQELDRIRDRISDPSFLANKGLSNEVGIHVFCYDPADELIVRDFVSRLKAESGTPYHIKECDLYEIFLKLLEDKRVLKSVDGLEEKRGKEYLLKQLQKIATPEALLEYMKYEPHEYGDVLFLTGVGKIFPFMRSHKMLDSMQHLFEDIPILSMFGDRIGRLLFKQTVEHNVMNHILASDTDIDAATYQKMRGMSYQEVVQTHGQISFPEVLRKEKAL